MTTKNTWQHAANEWADAATNGIQALKNVRDGISTADECIALLQADIDRARQSQPVTQSPRIEDRAAGESERAQFEKWYTGVFGPIPLRGDGQYKSGVLRSMLETWKARAALASATPSAAVGVANALGMALQHIRICAPDPTVDAELEKALSALASATPGSGFVDAAMKSGLEVGDADYNATLTIKEHVQKDGSVYRTATPGAAVCEADAWMPIDTAPRGSCVIVYWKEDGEDRFDFDVFDADEGVWVEHFNNYEHYVSVAPPVSRGPSETAPYTHWKRLTTPATPTKPGHMVDGKYSADEVLACAKRMKFYDHQIASAILNEYAAMLNATQGGKGEGE